MTSQKQQRLYFPGQQNLQITLGKKKPINPYQLITQTPAPIKQTQNSLGKGKFYYDHLIPDEQAVKSKWIKKNEKRKNYKTKMCPHGRDCRHRISCTFAHNEKELRRPYLRRTKPCKMYQMGQCQLGAACRQYHGNIDLMKKNYKYKSEPCKQFIANGNCQKGRACIFIHEMPSMQAQEDQEVQIDSQSQENVQDKQSQPEQPCQPIKKQALKPYTGKQAKEIVQVIEQKLGAEQVLQGGLCFNFIL